ADRGGRAHPPTAPGARPRALAPAPGPHDRRVKQSPERGVKLAAPAGFRLPRLDGLVEGLTATPIPRRSLTATYYDTADLRLARWGLTVRYRTGRHRLDGEAARRRQRPRAGAPRAAVRRRPRRTSRRPARPGRR